MNALILGHQMSTVGARVSSPGMLESMQPSQEAVQPMPFRVRVAADGATVDSRVGTSSFSDRSLTHHGRANQMTPLVAEVVDPAMQEEAVVPDDERVPLPPYPAVILDPLRQ